MKFDITHRLTGETLYTCELPADMVNESRGAQFGYAIRSAVSDRVSLRWADLRDADLSGADLRIATLRGADLSEGCLYYADLFGTYLRGACFSESLIKIDNIHQSLYAAASQPGALDMSRWNSECGTTHCRAGWVIALAGDAGRDLESRVGTSVAAALIYMSSDPELERIPDFYCSNEYALADMKRLAEMESARAAVC